MNFEKFLTPVIEDDFLLEKRVDYMLDETIELLADDNHSEASSNFLKGDLDVDGLMSYLPQLELPEVRQHRIIVQAGTQTTLKTLLIKNKTQSFFSKSSKKIKKVQNSPFHNYQKHLNNALKKLIIVPAISQNCEEFQRAAADIWSAYTQCQVKTKKILHFVFNEKNQHEIKEKELKVCGLLKVYQKYGQEDIVLAKTYLSKLAIDQINETAIQEFIKTRKMKKTLGFTDYVLSFRNELLGGYLKRRVQQ